MLYTNCHSLLIGNIQNFKDINAFRIHTFNYKGIFRGFQYLEVLSVNYSGKKYTHTHPNSLKARQTRSSREATSTLKRHRARRIVSHVIQLKNKEKPRVFH